MKKILLSSALALFGLMSAQINTGFEASQGYALGNLAGQSVWGNTTGTHSTVVSNERGAGGSAQSVKMVPGTSQATAGVISTTSYIYAPEIVLEFDFYLDAAAYQTWWMVTAQDPDAGSIVSRVVIGADIDELLVVDYTGTGGALAYTEIGSAAAFTRDAWHKVKAVMNFDDGEANYYLDGNLIYTGALVAGTTAVGNLVIANDNYDALGAGFVDNVKLYDAALSVTDVSKKAFSVFPNPTADFLNVAGKAKVESAQVFDLSGKAVSVSVTNNQVDVRNLAKGTYVVKIQTAEGTTTQKFIKK